VILERSANQRRKNSFTVSFTVTSDPVQTKQKALTQNFLSFSALGNCIPAIKFFILFFFYCNKKKAF